MRRKRTESAEIVVCSQGFATEEHSIRRGTRLRGDDPIVKAHPGFFVPAADGTNDRRLRLPEVAVTGRATVFRSQ